MVDRSMSAAMLTEIAKNSLHYFYLIEIQFATPVRYTTAQRDIIFNSNTYSSDGNLISLDDVKEDAALRIPKMNIVLSGAASANIAAALTEDYNNKKVIRHVGCIDSAGAMVVDPLEIWFGFIDNYVIDDDPEAGTSVVTWKAINDLGNFNQKRGRVNNSEVQHMFYPTDEGLEFTNQSTTSLKWGVN